MQLYRFLLPPEVMGATHDATPIRLEGEAASYLLRVLRLGVGAVVEAFDGRGRICEARIVSVEGRCALLALGEVREGLPLPPPFVLVQSVLKGEKMDWLVQKCTELGVSEIWPVFTARSIVRLDARKAEARRDRWEKIAEASTRQCGRADLPRIHLPAPLQVAMDAVSERSGILRMVAWEEAGAHLGLRTLLRDGPTNGHALVVGPEGGLESGEVRGAQERGFAQVSLGRRILRAETAGPAVLAAVRFSEGELGA